MTIICGSSLSFCGNLSGTINDLQKSICLLHSLTGRLFVRTVTVSADVAVRNHTASKKSWHPKAFLKPKWQLKIVANLANELNKEKLDTLFKLDRSAAVSELIRYAVNEDYSSLVAFAMKFTGMQKKKMTQYGGDDEFFAVALLLAARGLQKFTDLTLVDDAASASLFYSTATFLERLTLKGDWTRSAALVLLDRMEKWTDMRSIDERSSDIDKTYSSLQNLLIKELKFWRPKQDRLIINSEDQEIIGRRLIGMFGLPKDAVVLKEDNSYAESLSLVSGLRTPPSKSDYLGSPFCCGNLSKAEYLKKFKQQKIMETSHKLRVRNLCRNSKRMTVEKLVESWKWEKSIENVLAKRLQDLHLLSLKGYLESLNVQECASLIFSSVMAACSNGQNLIVYSQFIDSLADPLLNCYYEKFVERLGVRKQEISEELFLRMVDYFLDSSIARQFTVREWWMRCCSEAHVNPTLTSPFADLVFKMRAELGSFLLSVVFEACMFPKKIPKGGSIMTPAFSMRDVSIEEESMVIEENRVDLVKMVQIDHALIEIFIEHQFEWLIFSTDYLPMIAPPRPWIDHGEGGPSYNKPANVLRHLEEFRKFDTNSEVKKRLKTRDQARPVFDALNDLGSTPWKINEEMLSVIKEVFNMCGDVSKEQFLSTLSVPLKADTVEIPDYVRTFGEGVKVDEISHERWIEFSKAKYFALKKRAELNSLWYWMMYRIIVAESLKKEILYFPHNMDFRGRVYPISPYLSHMGDDFNRSLLLFAKGKPLGLDGLKWLKLHCINLTGKKKRDSIATRLAYAEDILPQILDSANNPLDGQQWWLESDDPWQTLAACMEVRNAVSCDKPEEYVSHFPVHQDGTCNGLQHYAALGRDREGGKEVNLLPCESPSDVYSGVAQRVEIMRVEDENSLVDSVKELALSLRKALPEVVPRKVIKQTVMTTVYGVTLYGAVQQIKRQLKALGISNEECAKFASYLAKKTFSSLDEAFASSMKIKDWFRSCAKTISRSFLRPVEWVTPLGLPVVQPYLRIHRKYNRLVLIPVPIKQINAFPPNFVHSLDSTHMMLTALNCRRLGITFAAVHDCYWTHACTVDAMNGICRDQFIKLHKQSLVKQCGQSFISTYLNNEVGRMMSPETFISFKNIFTSKFDFGDLNIEEVRDSTYFFS